MSEPFRDEMTAAAARIDQLADENAQLKSEVEQLRSAVTNVKEQSTDAHAHVLADQTLKLLERLDASMEQRVATAAAAGPMTIHSSDIARPDALVTPNRGGREIGPGNLLDAMKLPNTITRAHVRRVGCAWLFIGFIAGAGVVALLTRL